MSSRGPSWADWGSAAVLAGFSIALLWPADLPWFGTDAGSAVSAWCYLFAIPLLGVGWISGTPLRTALWVPLLAYAGCVVATAPFGADPAHTFGEAGKVLGIVLAALGAGWAVQAHRATGVAALVAVAIGLTVLQGLALLHHAEFGLAERIALYDIPAGWSGRPELGALVSVQFAVVTALLFSVRGTAARWVTLAWFTLTIVEAGLLYSRLA